MLRVFVAQRAVSCCANHQQQRCASGISNLVGSGYLPSAISLPLSAHPAAAIAAAGFIWNVEDAQPGGTVNFTRGQWDSLSHMAESLEAAGVKHHAYFELVSILRRYSYYCDDADLILVSLTASTLANHAIRQAAADTSARTTAADGAPHASSNSSGSKFVPNSAGAWPSGAAATAKQAAAMGVALPSMVERCALCKTLRAVKAGEEILEDYATYECPWPGCSSPIVKAVSEAALNKD
jgi:hypothetical protein